jgi:uncharacterized membrane protein YfcA
MSFLAIGLLGIIVGFVSSLLGVGGSIFIIPLLPLIIPISLKATIATGIFSVLMVTLYNSALFQRKKMIEWEVAFKIIPFTLLASFISARVSGGLSDQTISFVFSGIVIAMLWSLFFRKHKTIHFPPKIRAVIISTAGLVSGALNGMTGIGSGLILGPLLLSLKLVEPKKVSPVINVLILCACIGASSANYTFIEYHLAFLIFTGSIIGSYFGRKMNNTIGIEKRKLLLGTILLAVLIKMLML